MAVGIPTGSRKQTQMNMLDKKKIETLERKSFALEKEREASRGRAGGGSV